MKADRKRKGLDDRLGRLLFAGVWLLVGTIFLAVAVGVAYTTSEREKRFEREGETTEATILTKSITGGGGTRNSSKGRSYHVTYRFRAATGSTVVHTARVDASTWDSLREQSPATVLYIPSEPTINRLVVAGPGWTLPIIFGVLGTVLDCIGILALWLTSDKRQQRKRRRVA
jgi:hypothetical protein